MISDSDDVLYFRTTNTLGIGITITVICYKCYVCSLWI